MKNLVKVLGIIAVIAVIGLGVGCSVDPDEQTRITITDLPEGFEGKYAAVIVYEDLELTKILAVAGSAKKIKDGVAEAIPLFEYDAKTEAKGDAAKVKKGVVALVIDEKESMDSKDPLYVGRTDSPTNLGEGTVSIKASLFVPDITNYASGNEPTASEEVEDKYKGTYKTTYKLGSNDQDEFVELTTSSFNIYEKKNNAKDPDNFLDFTIETWDFVEAGDLPTGYVEGFKFTGYIRAGKPVTTTPAASISVYGVKTAPGFVQKDIDDKTKACMYLLFKADKTFVRTVFTKQASTPATPIVGNLITGNETPTNLIRVYTKQ